MLFRSPAVATNVPMPEPRPQRTALAPAEQPVRASAVTGYAPARGFTLQDAGPFAVFDLFTQVGGAWAPRDSQAARRSAR